MPVTRFSVVIPLYNKRPHVGRAIQSALAQTSPAHEIVVVDDGSRDGGYEYVRDLADPRIKLHQRTQPGPGGYAARNDGIAHATGDWIAFLDADDEWLPDHLETIARTMQLCDRPEALVSVATGFRIVFPSGKEELDIYARHRKQGGPEFLDFEQFLGTWLAVGGAPIWTSATACRKDALIAAGLFPAGRCTRGGDKDMWLRVAAQGVTAINPAITAIYFKDSVNMVTAGTTVHARHCICHSVEAMLDRAKPAAARLLRKVYNLEIFKYCVLSVKNARVNRAIWRGFYAAESPIQYLILNALSNPLTDGILRRLLNFRSARLKRR